MQKRNCPKEQKKEQTPRERDIEPIKRIIHNFASGQKPHLGGSLTD